MSADTRLYGRPPARTPEQAAGGANAMIAAAFARPRRWPRRWPPYPTPAADNTPFGDLHASDVALADRCDHDRAQLADPERYQRTCG